MAYIEFLNPRRNSPYASRTKHPIYKPRRPLVWQNDMAEVRETYRRVAHVKDTAYTGFSCLDPARTASTLSKNRVARRAMQHSFEPMDFLNSATPFEAFQHVQNVRKMCRRIQSLGSLAERKKNPWDVGLYPALVRRPSTACPVKQPLCHRGNMVARPFTVPTYTNRTPRCYTHAPFSTLLDISNKPQQACQACHFKAPFDRPSQQDKSCHSRSAVYSIGRGRSQPAFLTQDLPTLPYHSNTSKFPALSKEYLGDNQEGLVEIEPDMSSTHYFLDSHTQYASQGQDQTSPKNLNAKPPLEKPGAKVERRYPRGQTGKYSFGSSSLEHPTLDTDCLSGGVPTESDSSSDAEKLPPRHLRSRSSCQKTSTHKTSDSLDSEKPSKDNFVKPRAQTSSRAHQSLNRSNLLLERPPSRVAVDRSNLSLPSSECSSPRGADTMLGMGRCEGPACAHAISEKVEVVKMSRQNVNVAEDPTMVSASTSTTRGDIQEEDFKEKEGFYETAEGGVMVKHSTDPYSDFKTSMMNMIVEENLQNRPLQIEELFQYYLDLNPGLHHKVIQQVIQDIRVELRDKGMM